MLSRLLCTLLPSDLDVVQFCHHHGIRRRYIAFMRGVWLTVLLAPCSQQAPVSGSKGPAINGQLILLCAGDESLFKDAAAALSKMVRS